MKKLAIISTHPIQYNAPFFKLLHERKNIEVKVFYTWGSSVLNNKYDPGFKKEIVWDIPLLDGYNYTFLNNTSKNKGSHHFFGIKNPSLTKEIENWNADFVLIFGWSFHSHLKAIKYFKNKIPVLFRGDSNLLDSNNKLSIKKFIRFILLKWIYKSVDIAFYVGKANKDYFLKFGMDADKLVFAPHAIDNFRFSANRNPSFKSSIGIPTDSVLILFAGKFESKKNPLLLLEAFKLINNKKVHLLFVGNGELENNIKDTIKSMSPEIASKIHLLPFQNQTEMPNIYNSSDIFILPSKGPNETWGLSVNEAMAAGNAIIVSDKCGCHPDLVHEEKNGIVFKSNDLNSLVDAINKVTENNNYKLMGKASENIIKKWNFVTIAESIESKILNYNS